MSHNVDHYHVRYERHYSTLLLQCACSRCANKFMRPPGTWFKIRRCQGRPSWGRRRRWAKRAKKKLHRYRRFQHSRHAVSFWPLLCDGNFHRSSDSVCDRGWRQIRGVDLPATLPATASQHSVNHNNAISLFVIDLRPLHGCVHLSFIFIMFYLEAINVFAEAQKMISISELIELTEPPPPAENRRLPAPRAHLIPVICPSGRLLWPAISQPCNTP